MIRHLCLVLALLAVPASASAQVAAPPAAPVILGPKNGFVRPLPGPVTLRVQGMPNEPAGSLGVELKTSDAEPHQPSVDEGRYDADDPYFVESVNLVETEPGSGVYEVTVEYDGGGGYYWHAFRRLTKGQNCEPRTGGAYDCFQESAERAFSVEDPVEHGAREPRNNTPSGATFNDGLTTDGWLEKTDDVDWYHFKSGKGRNLEVLIGNYFAGRVPAGENAGIEFAVYRASRMGSPIVKRRLAAGVVNKTLKARIRPRTRYRLVVRHVVNALPATRDIEYSFYIEKGAGG